MVIVLKCCNKYYLEIFFGCKVCSDIIGVKLLEYLLEKPLNYKLWAYYNGKHLFNPLLKYINIFTLTTATK